MVTLVSSPTVQYGFAFGDGTSNQFAFGGTGQSVQVLSVEGLESFPNLRTQDLSRGYADGTFTGRDFLDARIVTFHLQVMGAGPDQATASAGFRQAMSDLQQFLSMQRAGTSVLQMYLPRYGTDASNSVRRLYGRVRRRQVNIDPTYVYGRAEVLLEFYCPDPRIYDETVQTVSLSSTGGTVRNYNRTYNLTYPNAGSGTNQATATNLGTYEAWPTFTITGACTNPTIYNAVTGLATTKLSFGVTLGSSDTLTVDTDMKTVLLNGVAQRNILTSDSRWFSLLPPSGGVNQTSTLQLTASAGTATAVGTFRYAYI